MLSVYHGPILPDIYLQEVIRGVVYQHDESSSTDVVNAPREADEQDGRYVVNNLLLEVLKKVTHSHVGQMLRPSYVTQWLLLHKRVCKSSLRGNWVIMLRWRNMLGLLGKICPAVVSCLKLSKVLTHTHTCMHV